MSSRPLRKRIKYASLYYLIRFLFFVSQITPRRAWLSFCGFLGRVYYTFDKKIQALCLQNLTIAYGSEKSKEELKKIAKTMFVFLGKNAGDVFRARNVKSMKDLDAFMDIHGLEKIDGELAKGKSCIFLTGHIGAFDLMVMTVSLRGFKPLIIGAPVKDERLNELMFEYRNRHGAVAVERGKEMFRLMKTLKSGGTIAMLIDQDTRVKSRFVNFFGKPAATPVGAAILAMKTGAIVFPVFIHLDSNGRQQMDVFDAVPTVITGDDEQDMITNTQNYTTIIESMVRQHPEQWVWMHERWKTKPGEEVQ